jgi:hypothetical protein
MECEWRLSRSASALPAQPRPPLGSAQSQYLFKAFVRLFAAGSGAEGRPLAWAPRGWAPLWPGPSRGPLSAHTGAKRIFTAEMNLRGGAASRRPGAAARAGRLGACEAFDALEALPRLTLPPFPLPQMYVEENTQFQLKVVSKSGLDLDGTYLPPAIHPSLAPEPKTDMKTAMLEAEMVMGSSVADVLEKTGAHARGKHGSRGALEPAPRRGAGPSQRRAHAPRHCLAADAKGGSSCRAAPARVWQRQNAPRAARPILPLSVPILPNLQRPVPPNPRPPRHQARAGRHPDHQLQHLLPHAVPGLHADQQVQVPPRRRGLPPRRHGLQHRRRRRRPRAGHAQGGARRRGAPGLAFLSAGRPDVGVGEAPQGRGGMRFTTADPRLTSPHRPLPRRPTPTASRCLCRAR